MTRNPRPSGRHRNRRGSSLLEAVVVVGITSMMFIPVMAMLHLILGAGRNTSQELRESLLLSRIAEQFRRDVHAAVDSRLFPEPPDPSAAKLSLTLPGGRIVAYRRDANRLTRIVTEAGHPLQRDRFTFRPGSTIRFAQEPAAHRIALTITRPRRSNSSAPPTATPAKDRAAGKSAVTKRNPRSPVSAPKPSGADRSAIKHPTAADRSPRHVIRFEAVLGRDHRFQKKAAK